MGGFEPHTTLLREARREAWWIEGVAYEEGRDERKKLSGLRKDGK
jgi:hypothetical protein